MNVYEMPYDSYLPVICMDEKPYQRLDNMRDPLPMRVGDIQIVDAEYVRKGTCSIFVFVELLAWYRYVHTRAQRTAVDWAEKIEYLLPICYPDKDRIILNHG